MEYKTVREALEMLVSANEVAQENFTTNGHVSTYEDLQEFNCEIAYNLCDLLGMSDLYLSITKAKK